MYRENEELKCIMCNKLYTYFNAYVIAYTSYTMEPHYNELKANYNPIITANFEI